MVVQAARVNLLDYQVRVISLPVINISFSPFYCLFLSDGGVVAQAAKVNLLHYQIRVISLPVINLFLSFFLSLIFSFSLMEEGSRLGLPERNSQKSL